MPAPIHIPNFRPSYISLLLLLLILFLIEFQLVVMQKKLNKVTQKLMIIQSQQVAPQNSQNEEVVFEKRTVHFTGENLISAEIDAVNEKDLIGLRCTQVIANDGSDTFWWRSPYSHDMYDKVDDPLMIAALKEADISQPSGRGVISARFCESEYGNVLMHYVVAKKADHGNKGYYDGKDVDAYLTVLDENAAFTPGIQIMHESVWPYALCNAPVQMTNEGKVYMLCGVAYGGKATNYLHVVNLVAKQSALKVRCDYDHENNKLGESCKMM